VFENRVSGERPASTLRVPGTQGTSRVGGPEPHESFGAASPRGSSGFGYFVQIGERRHCLCTDRGEAFRLYHELMSKPPEEPKAEMATGDGLIRGRGMFNLGTRVP